MTTPPAARPTSSARPTNDKACASIPICIPGRDRDCTPPDEKKVDLGITKEPRSDSCTADGVCYSRIDVFNNGTDTYNGPLTVIDDYPAGVPASSDFVPTAALDLRSDRPASSSAT